MGLREILLRATFEKWAVPHFNFSNLETLKAIAEAAKEEDSPVMAGTSEGERDFIGLREAVFMVRSFREELNLPIFLNADHTKSVEAAKKAVDAGYDSIHIDLSKMPLDANVNGTKELVRYALAKDAIISIEGELGYLRGESKFQKKRIVIEPNDLTDPAEAAKFVEITGVDRFAPAVGNIHGISLDEPAIDIGRIKQIRADISQNVIMVLHAGSGIPDDDICLAIKSGIANIHISTELRMEFRKELEESLKKDADEAAPYKIMKPVVQGLKEKIKEKINLFGSAGKAL